MGGSKPDWAGSDDYATLEEVFKSRTFGHALPKAQTHITTLLVWRRGELAPPVLALRTLIASWSKQKWQN